jgi:hypothetical protein
VTGSCQKDGSPQTDDLLTFSIPVRSLVKRTMAAVLCRMQEALRDALPYSSKDAMIRNSKFQSGPARTK